MECTRDIEDRGPGPGGVRPRPARAMPYIVVVIFIMAKIDEIEERENPQPAHLIEICGLFLNEAGIDGNGMRAGPKGAGASPWTGAWLASSVTGSALG